MKEKVKIGWSEVSITPTEKIRLAGQFYERISEYVETPITVTAMAVQSGKEQMILCSVDITSIDFSLVKLVRDKISANRPDIDGKKIILAATHTHNSFEYEKEKQFGLSALARFLGEEDNYNAEEDEKNGIMSGARATEFLVEKIYSAATAAFDAREEAVLANGFGRAAVGMCRRVVYKEGCAKMWGDVNSPDFKELEGGNDSGIELLFTYDTSKKLKGIAVNIACPSQVLEHRRFISSDYWGKLKILLREEFGEDLKILGLCSPAGDQCPRDLIRWISPETPIEDPNIKRNNPLPRISDPSMFDIRGRDKVASRIATEIIDAYNDIDEYSDRAEFVHRVIDMPLPLRRVTEEENKAALAAIEEFKKIKEHGTISFEDNAAMHVHAGTAERFIRQQSESNILTEIHIVRLGNIAIGTNPFELFLDFGNAIRALSAAPQTFLIQLACGSLGYLPTEKAERGGHYSAYVSSGNVGHEGGKLLVKNTLEVIADLFRK